MKTLAQRKLETARVPSWRLAPLLLVFTLAAGLCARAETPSLEAFLETCDPEGKNALGISAERLAEGAGAQGELLLGAIRPSDQMWRAWSSHCCPVKCQGTPQPSIQR